jgi:hypothetical protein
MGILLFWLICGLLAALIASQRGNQGCGFALLGFLLGPVGIILTLLLSGYQCPYCRKKISREASTCPYCRKELKFKPSDPENERTKELIRKITNSQDPPAD